MLEEFKLKFKNLTKYEKRVYVTSVVFVLLLSIYSFLNRPPVKFPFNEVITVEPGQSLQEITDQFHQANIIRFPFIFRTTVIILGGERKVIAGDYLMDEKAGPVDIAYRLIKGQFHTEALRITIPEGWNIFEIAEYLGENIVDFNEKEFIRLAKNKEGYLFPDTYFVSTTIRPKAIISLMNETFKSKIKSISGFSTTTKSMSEIITMASIIEAEANTYEGRRIVSGILWKRISIKMPLQVDATFSYINGKGTAELTYADLDIDSPYNTYEYKGLPPSPINNPSLDSIQAALYPTNTKYLYFLTGRDGKMYYARTFEEHKRNKQLYLYN